MSKKHSRREAVCTLYNNLGPTLRVPEFKSHPAAYSVNLDKLGAILNFLFYNIGDIILPTHRVIRRANGQTDLTCFAERRTENKLTINVINNYYHHCDWLQEFPLQPQASPHECFLILSLSDYTETHISFLLTFLPTCLWPRHLPWAPKHGV